MGIQTLALLATLNVERARFADARALKAYAGAAPVTRASGRSISSTRRKVRNDRLAAAGYLWAFVAATDAEPAKQHYQRQRDHGDRHPAVLRNLFNQLLGCLRHCLATGQRYDPAKAFEARLDAAAWITTSSVPFARSRTRRRCQPGHHALSVAAETRQAGETALRQLTD